MMDLLSLAIPLVALWAGYQCGVLREREHTALKHARAEQVVEEIAQAIEAHAESHGDPADNAYEYARIARQLGEWNAS